MLSLPSPGARAEGEPGPASGASTLEAKWNRYLDKERRFQLRYPAELLVVSTERGLTRFRHSIAFEHPDPCDFTDSGRVLKDLTDFSVTIQVLDQTLKETVKATSTDLVVSRYLRGEELTIEPGFIDTVRIGTLEGYRITSGAEGCGRRSYYFPLGAGATLHVERDFVTELDPVIRDHRAHLELPGVIPPQREADLFERMLRTFELLR